MDWFQKQQEEFGSSDYKRWRWSAEGRAIISDLLKQQKNKCGHCGKLLNKSTAHVEKGKIPLTAVCKESLGRRNIPKPRKAKRKYTAQEKEDWKLARKIAQQMLK